MVEEHRRTSSVFLHIYTLQKIRHILSLKDTEVIYAFIFLLTYHTFKGQLFFKGGQCFFF